MMLKGVRCGYLTCGLLFGLSTLIPAGVAADALGSSIGVQTKTDDAAKHSQRKIDSAADQTSSMLEQYQQAVREADSLRIYNDHVEKLITSQTEEMASIKNQLQEIAVTSREVVPLMLRMIATLKRFVELDTPFLPEERAKRIATLETLMVRADISNSEKFRRVIEAYQVEMEYGRTIEAYRDTLTLNNQERSVEFLRIGRIGLYYQTLDSEHSGIWNPQTRKWEDLPGNYRNPIRHGLRIAKKQAAPDLLTLPVSAPEKVK